MYRDLGSNQSTELERYQSCSLQEEKLDSASFSAMQLATYRSTFLRLQTRGVVLTDHLHADVTHVVMLPIRDRSDSIQVSSLLTEVFLVLI
jgi:hypothetical protein